MVKNVENTTPELIDSVEALTKKMKAMRKAQEKFATYTQEQVAEDLGCTISFISNIENNRAKLNLRVLTYYAELFHVTVDSILNAGREGKKQRDVSEVLDTEVLDILHQFSAEEQERILKVLRYIRELKG